jgi:drug/metabolite transporter (DMT)-like permease
LAARFSVSEQFGSVRQVPLNAALIQVLLCAIWGLGQVGIKAVATDISPLMHAGIRSAGAAIVLLLWILWKKPQVFQRDATLGLGLIIGTLFGVEFIFLFNGLMLTTAARGTLMLYTSSFFVAIGAHFFIANEKLTLRKVIGLICAFGGVLLVMGPKLASSNGSAGSTNREMFSPMLIGDGLCLLAAFAWAATTLVVKTTKLRTALPEKTLIYQLGFSSVVLLGASYAAQENGIAHVTPLLLGVLGYGIFLVASVTYLTWFWLVTRYNATTLHTFTFLTPLFAMVFGTLLLNEQLGVEVMMATLLIATGIILVNKA